MGRGGGRDGTHNSMREVVCQECGAVFMAGLKSAKWCSSQCKNANRNRVYAERAKLRPPKPPPEPITVACKRCGETFEAKRADARQCKKCRAELNLERGRSTHAVKVASRPDLFCADCGVPLKRSVTSTQPKRCVPHQLEFDAIRRVANDRRRRFSRHGGFTQEQFEALFDAQGRACAICKGDVVDSRGRNGMLDHDHECCAGDYGCPRCIRGVLCTRCNQGIGYFRDDVTLLKKVISYLVGRE